MSNIADWGIRLEHIGLHVENMEETIQWYHQVFGFELINPSFEKTFKFVGGSFPRCCTMRLGSIELEIYELQDPFPFNYNVYDYTTGLKHLSFEIENMDAWIAHAKSLNLEMAIENDYGSRNSKVVYVKDNSGMLVEVTNVREKKPLCPEREDYYNGLVKEHSAVDGIYKVSMFVDTKDEFGQKLSNNGYIKMYYQDDQLKGSMVPCWCSLNSPFRNGKVDGNKFSFTLYISSPTRQFAMEVSGQVDGDRITGRSTTPMGSCHFEGARIPEEELGLWGFDGTRITPKSLR